MDAWKLGLEVKVSSLIEHNATEEQKENGYDLADYLISQQRQINEKKRIYWFLQQQNRNRFEWWNFIK